MNQTINRYDEITTQSGGPACKAEETAGQEGKEADDSGTTAGEHAEFAPANQRQGNQP